MKIIEVKQKDQKKAFLVHAIWRFRYEKTYINGQY